MEAKLLSSAADRLVELYDCGFGGKTKGRYRIAKRLLCDLSGRRRLYEDDIRELTRALMERGFVLIDMDTFFVIMSSNTFVNYRRANEDSIA